MVLMFSEAKGDQGGVYMQATVTDVINKGQYARYRAVVERIWLSDEPYKKRQMSM